jgi:hypothetical protein
LERSLTLAIFVLVEMLDQFTMSTHKLVQPREVHQVEEGGADLAVSAGHAAEAGPSTEADHQRVSLWSLSQSSKFLTLSEDHSPQEDLSADKDLLSEDLCHQEDLCHLGNSPHHGPHHGPQWMEAIFLNLTSKT